MPSIRRWLSGRRRSETPAFMHPVGPPLTVRHRVHFVSPADHGSLAGLEGTMNHARTIGLLAVVGAVSLLLLAALQPAQAAPVSRFVTPAGSGTACSRAAPCSLQTALALSGTSDKIYAAQGTYTGSDTAVVMITTSVGLYGGWDGGTSGLVVTDPVAHPSVLDGQGARRVMRISGAIQPSVDGFTIKGGDASGLTAGCGEPNVGGCGGGVFIKDAQAYISRCTIRDNVAAKPAAGVLAGLVGYGGGIYAVNASGTVITGNTILSNTAHAGGCGEGGGVFLSSSGNMSGLQVTDNRILSNTAGITTTVCPSGGGIYGGPDGALIQGNTISGNRANTSGGGIGAAIGQTGGSALYRGNLVTGNLGAAGAAAVYVFNSGSWWEANVVLDNSTTRAVRFFGASGAGPVLVNDVIGRSVEDGLSFGAALGSPVTVTVLNCTVVGAGLSDGVRVDSGPVTLYMTNTIVSGFWTGVENTAPLTATVRSSHTLLWNNTNDGLSGDSPVYQNPRFGADGYHISLGSAAVDAGAAVPLGNDIDGDPRPNGPAWDIGADEAQFHRAYLPVVLRF
jgi:hypothetical protein